MEVIEAIKTRRSVRHYLTKPVDEETLAEVLEAARWAPSWSNTQCARFIVVRDSETKERLAETLPKTNSAAGAIVTAPLVIVACAELGQSGYYGGETPATDKGDWFMFDVGLAMENLVLAAHSLGLGTVYIGLFDARKAGIVMGVPRGFTVVAMTPLGYPEHAPRPTPRKALSEIVSYERFGGG